MMNQSASATRRPSGSTATAGCCPMLVHPQFFVNPFPTQTPLPQPPAAQQCLHTRGAQALPLQLPTVATTNAPQVNQPTTAPVSNSNGVATNTTVSANISTTNGTGNNNNNHPSSQHQQQPSQQQPQASRQDHSNYSTSLSAHPFPLQHLLAGRHPANCMALAAALASASFHQHQQLQQVHQQQLQQAPINHPQPPATNVTSTGGPLPTPPTSTTNQVPLLNFNSYNAAQPFLNIPAPTPLAAHLNLSNNHHQQQPTNTINSTNSNVALSAPHSNNNTGNQIVHQPIGGHRPLATNTTLNSAANQQPTNNYRTAPQPPQVQQQQPQLNLAGRNLLNDEALSTLFTEHFQAIILNQLIGIPQFTPSVVPIPPINSSRPQQQHVSPTPSGPTVASPAQPQPAPQSANSVNQQQQQQQPTETHVVDQQQAQQQSPPTFQPVSQTTAQARMAQAPPMDSYSSSTTDNMYQQQTSEPVTLQAQQPPQQQQPQPIPPIPFYSFPQMEQALALLTNPQVANNLFSQVFNIYLQSGLRSESHHTHHHHHQPHHYHHHLHGSHHHHHHHHGPNGQNNGQDDTMLTISESKPRGLNRAEIDSLTPYIQMNEKDPRTCVICLSRFELKSKIRPLPCNHAFHAKCVDKWLRANRTCPICRRDALKTYGAKIKRI